MAERGWRKRILPRGRTPLLLTFVIVGVIVGVYYAYYRSQVAYYTGRNLRILATLTAQVDDRVSQYARFVKSAVETHETVPIDVGVCVAPDPPSAAGEVTRKLRETGRGWSIVFQYLGSLTLRSVEGSPMSPQDVIAKPEDGGVALASGEPACGTISLDEVVRPVVSRKAASAFDLFIVADATGRVLYTIRPPAPTYTVLRTEHGHVGTESDRSAEEQKLESPLTITHLGALSRRSGWRKYEKLDLEELKRGTRHASVMIDGVDYLAFTQPHTFAGSATSANGAQQQWIVAGLVTASRFRYDAWAVSTSTILLAVGLVLIGICCWPYLRIAFINEIEELTITDVVLIVLCTITGVAIVVLIVLDMLAYRRVSGSLDQQLRSFGRRINDDFEANVERAAAMLKALEDRTRANWPADDAAMVELLRGDAAVQAYPYIQSFSWIRFDGVQYFKFVDPSDDAAGGRRRNPRVSVAERPYFKAARDGQTWKVGQQEYVLEWVRSFATGQMTAVLARSTGLPEFPVITVGTELIDLSTAIHPPGVEFAIIDDDGAVLFHSDQQRIGYENFFAETDWDRDLRAAVVSRREGLVNATYWGEDQRMFVRPLKNSSWTLVTFGAKRLLRVLNLEAVLLTLLLLILSATPYFLIYMTVLFLRPWYRAPALWPDPLRRGEYGRLLGIYALALLLYALCIYAVTPWSYFTLVFAIPAQTIVATYLVLHRRDPRRHRFHVAMLIWLVIWGALLVSLFRATVDAGLLVSRWPEPTKAVLIALALTTMAVVAAFSIARTTLGRALRPARGPDSNRRPPRDFAQKATVPLVSLAIRLLTTINRGARHVGLALVPDQVQKRVHYGTLYRLCGLMLLIIGVVMPVIGFFRISTSVEMELLVKYTQLRASADLEHRIHHLQELNLLGADARERVAKDMTGYEPTDIFTRDWTLVPRSQMPDCDETNLAPPTLPPDVVRWMPAVYDDSIAIRQLHDSASADGLWKWCREGRVLSLDRLVRIEREAAALLFKHPEVSPRQTLRISSDLQHLLSWKTAEWMKERLGEDEIRRDAAGFALLVLLLALIAALLSILWFIADFIATRVLLIDVNEPLWLARLPLSPTLGDQIFLVRRAFGVDDLTGKGTKSEFFDVRFAELEQQNSWDAALREIDASPTGRNIRIHDFEYRVEDGAINAKKLNWLERLLKLPDRTVIVVSAVSPPFLLTTPPPPTVPPEGAAAYHDRWQGLLRGFVWVTEEQLELRKAEYRRSAVRQPWAQPRTFLAEETAYNPFLTRLAGELDAHSDRRQLLDEIAERADTYYAGLWGSCTDDEKLLLYHLAHNGLVNAKNRRLLRRLIARGLVRRDPNLELFSETFRLFVLSAARREEIVTRAKAAAPASTWSSLRLPMFVVLLTFLALLFGTQKDLLTATTAITTALTTGLPLIVKLFGMITERRLEQAERT